MSKGFFIDDETYDLVFDSRGNLVVVEDLEELRLQYKLVLRTRLGEWFLNPFFGLDVEQLLGKRVDDDLARDAVQEALEQVPATDRVLRIDIDKNDSERTVTVSVEVQIENGDILDIEEVL